MELEKKLEYYQRGSVEKQRNEYPIIKIDNGAKYEKPEVIIPLYSGEIPTAGCCLRSCGGKS